MTDDELELHAMTTLAQALGPGGFARYLLLQGRGSGDYTAERHQWLDGRTVDQIWRDMEAQGLVHSRTD